MEAVVVSEAGRDALGYIGGHPLLLLLVTCHKHASKLVAYLHVHTCHIGHE
jgi:hypothetical protein